MVSGLTYLVAHPPVGVGASAYLVVPLLLAAIAIDPRPSRLSAFRAGATMGVVAFGPLLTWLIAPAGLLAWILLVLIQGVFFGLFAALASEHLDRARGLAFVAVIWTGLQVMRGFFPLGGFDWATLSYAQVDGGLFLPLARIAGHRATELAIAALGVSLFAVGRAIVENAAGLPNGTWSARIRASVDEGRGAFLALAGVLAFGALATIEPPGPTGEVVDVLAAQGIDADTERLAGRDEDLAIAGNLRRVTLDSVAASGRPDITVWPESSLDRDPFGDVGADLLPIAQEVARAVGGGLLVGANLTGDEPATFLNAAVVFGADGGRGDQYVKRHLVPFGEYVPARSVIGDLPPLRQIRRDGVPGPDEQVIDIGPARVAVAICFETLFSGVVRENVLAADAGLLIASTNDSSFGRSAESAQHIAQSRMRAVETGRWVVHAALSGQSAVIDPHGRVVDSTTAFTADTIRHDIPLTAGETPFLVVGDIVGGIAGFAFWVAAVLGLIRWRALRVAARYGSGPTEATGEGVTP